jgi:hypothetical protein
VLAYVFWHRPEAAADISAYEDAQRAFHTAIEVPSASFRIDRRPFGEGGGYEDWYLVEDWAALGELNESAIDDVRRPSHDQAASHAAAGWGSVYELVRGVAEIPAGLEWLEKPRGESSAEFIDSLPHESVWRRQLVLGPAPEFCGATAGSNVRVPLAR